MSKSRSRKEDAEPQHLNGAFVFPDGSTYEGDYTSTSNGAVARQGKGMMKFLDGSTYNGEWKDDKMHGNGLLTNADGSSYAGEFKKGKFDGEGEYTFADGARLFSTWKENQPQKDSISKLHDQNQRVWQGQLTVNDEGEQQGLFKPQLVQ
eukprot:TRINITY_DN4657_c0_g1_i1.p1 TRINITY_DN4657_c0_g1~~TRINITY_DN4657_c0_g1_i1.p1  ORF type:complete len:150 (+),score=26.36 TRINITY_DN4657_c0_g1_i1:71-520(+)